jgi:hypothetical protein
VRLATINPPDRSEKHHAAAATALTYYWQRSTTRDRTEQHTTALAATVAYHSLRLLPVPASPAASRSRYGGGFGTMLGGSDGQPILAIFP